MWRSASVVYVHDVYQRFSQFVSSNHYVMVWTSLYNTAGIQRCPILPFDLTYSMFKNHWINANSKLSSPCITNVTPSHLTYDEESALWYVAGYLIRSLDKKIEKGRYIHKEEMLQTLHNFVEDKEAHSHDEEFATSAWFNFFLILSITITPK